MYEDSYQANSHTNTRTRSAPNVWSMKPKRGSSSPVRAEHVILRLLMERPKKGITEHGLALHSTRHIIALRTVGDQASKLILIVTAGPYQHEIRKFQAGESCG